MAKRRMITLLFALSLASASLTPKVSTVRMEGDINGDQRVDILDLQVLASRMLTASDGEFPSGIVSVKHLQRTFNYAGLPESDQPYDRGTLADFCQGVILGHQISPPFLQLILLGLEPFQEKPETVAPVKEEQYDTFVPPLRTIRYIFQLAPNAPPVSA